MTLYEVYKDGRNPSSRSTFSKTQSTHSHCTRVLQSTILTSPSCHSFNNILPTQSRSFSEHSNNMKFFTSLLLLAASPLAILAAPLPGDAGLVAKDLGLYVDLFPNIQQCFLSRPWVMLLWQPIVSLLVELLAPEFAQDGSKTHCTFPFPSAHALLRRTARMTPKC
jgi:hypothetical protein